MTKQLSTDEIVAQAMGSMDKLDRIAAELIDVTTINDTERRFLVTETQWLPGTLTPAHDGEYEVLHPVTGMVERAAYDTLFEAWTCEWQYPTWRGCTEQVT